MAKKRSDRSKLKFVIVSHRPGNGGPCVLHELCQELVEKGYKSKIFYIGGAMRPQENYFSYFCHWIFWTFRTIFHKRNALELQFDQCKRKWFPWVGRNTVVVYPEQMARNFLHGKKIVRWFLSFEPYPGVKNVYGPHDLFFAYSKKFNAKHLNPEEKILHITFFDKRYKDYGLETREGCCYIIRKGRSRPDLPKHFDGPIIDTWSIDEQVEAFNRYRFCYIYDLYTFYEVVAAYCGCIPVVIMEPGKRVEDYRENEVARYGVAFGNTEEEIVYAIKTRPKLIEKVNILLKENDESVDYFLRICEDYFVKGKHDTDQI